MAKYKLSNVVKKEVNTKYGTKPKVDCSITSDDGQITDAVSIWSSFADFANLKDGDVVDGELEIKQNGNYTNKTLKSPPTGTTGPYRGNPGAITKAMDRKEQGIEKFQDNKELGIKISSTIRMAVDLVAATESEGWTMQQKQSEIKQWRKWLWENWSADDKDFAPFPSTPDMRVKEEDRNITPDQITFEQPTPEDWTNM